jgi:hypothetical protein
VRQQEELARGIHVRALVRRGVPRPANLDTIDCGHDVV